MESTPLDPVSPAPPTFKNRRGLLIAFGIVQVLIGCALLFMCAIMALVSFGGLTQGQTQPSPTPVSPAVLALIGAAIYGLPAIIFVALGIGSIMAKNWARIATLVVSWIWLSLGIVQLFVVVFLMPSILRTMPRQPNQPANLEQMVVVGAGIFFGAFFVVLPAIFLFAYHSKHVRATCLQGATVTAGQQTPPVLWVLTIWMALGVIGMVYILFTRYPAVVFGVLIPGISGKLIYLATGVAYAWAAWGLWRRHLVAWRVTFWMQTFWVASAIITFATHDIVQLYRDMGMSAQELAYIEKSLLPMNSFVWLCTLPTFAFLGLLFYARRYFSPSLPTQPPAVP